MEEYYLRIRNNRFGFVNEETHNLKETDIKITKEEYDKFFELQSQGNQFRLKEKPTGTGLFDYIEEYIPEVVEEVPESGLNEFMLDVEYRLSKLELGV